MTPILRKPHDAVASGVYANGDGYPFVPVKLNLAISAAVPSLSVTLSKSLFLANPPANGVLVLDHLGAFLLKLLPMNITLNANFVYLENPWKSVVLKSNVRLNAVLPLFILIDLTFNINYLFDPSVPG